MLINDYIHKERFKQPIQYPTYFTKPDLILIMHDLLTTELNLRDDKGIMQFIDSMKVELGGDTLVYSFLKRNVYKSNQY